MPDGSIWQLPAEFIANIRAKYYADKDKEKDNNLDWQTVYDDEYKYTLGDDYELQDWLSNNMNWEDFEDQLTQLAETEKKTYAKMWQDAEIEVVDR